MWRLRYVCLFSFDYLIYLSRLVYHAHRYLSNSIALCFTLSRFFSLSLLPSLSSYFMLWRHALALMLFIWMCLMIPASQSINQQMALIISLLHESIIPTNNIISTMSRRFIIHGYCLCMYILEPNTGCMNMRFYILFNYNAFGQYILD